MALGKGKREKGKGKGERGKFDIACGEQLIWMDVFALTCLSFVFVWRVYGMGVQYVKI